MIVLVALLFTVVGAGCSSSPTYRVDFVMPNAAGAVPGDNVMMRGQTVGKIDGDPKVTGQPGDVNRALITVDVDPEFAPLTQGTSARIVWLATVGQRELEILPGPPGAPALPSGATVVSGHERVEIDQVLAALDPATRQHLNGLVQGLQQTIHGQEGNLAQTVKTGGPTVDALGQVLNAVGKDGPALRQLITQVRQVTDVLSKRRNELAGSIQHLGPVANSVASEQSQLSDTLKELPPTLHQAKDTLGKVPDAVDAAKPLLEDLKPATAQLPGIAQKLKPVLRDLRPTIADLKPTLQDANRLLDRTPSLLDSAHAVVPPLTYTVGALRPVLAWVRPYSPEAFGWLANWNSLFASKTPEGNYGRALITESGTSLDDNPGVLPPGESQDPTPLPGSIVNQTWTDAHGDGLR